MTIKKVNGDKTRMKKVSEYKMIGVCQWGGLIALSLLVFWVFLRVFPALIAFFPPHSLGRHRSLFPK
jgi:hypothetical protein